MGAPRMPKDGYVTARARLVSEHFAQRAVWGSSPLPTGFESSLGTIGRSIDCERGTRTPPFGDAWRTHPGSLNEVTGAALDWPIEPVFECRPRVRLIRQDVARYPCCALP